MKFKMKVKDWEKVDKGYTIFWGELERPSHQFVKNQESRLIIDGQEVQKILIMGESFSTPMDKKFLITKDEIFIDKNIITNRDVWLESIE